MTKKRGVGFAAVHYGTGQTEGGDPAQAIVKMRPDGSVDLLIGSVDIGQGVRTVMQQIAAQELGVTLDRVNVSVVDTDTSPLDTGTFASRVTHQCGNAVLQATAELRKILFDAAAEMMKVDPKELVAKDNKIYTQDSPREPVNMADVAGKITWVDQKTPAGRGTFGWAPAPADPETGAGEPSHTLAYGATVVELEVDTGTGEVTLLKMASAYDCGKAINPMLVEGQIDGGMAMGIGSGLYEELNPYYPSLDSFPTGLFEYVVPTSKDIPPMKSVIVEMNSHSGPYGAKGIGEMTANSEAPAIVNAIHDAVGVWITDLPATPEKILRALEAKEKAEKKSKKK